MKNNVDLNALSAMFLGFLIGIILISLFSSCTSKYKYLIKDKKGDSYLCNSYIQNNDGTVTFKDKPGVYTKDGFFTRLSQPYTIKQLK